MSHKILVIDVIFFINASYTYEQAIAHQTREFLSRYRRIVSVHFLRRASLTIATFDFLRRCSLRIFSSNPIQASSSKREEVSARRRRFFLKDNRTRPLSFSAASPCISVARLSCCFSFSRERARTTL